MQIYARLGVEFFSLSHLKSIFGLSQIFLVREHGYMVIQSRPFLTVGKVCIR